MMCPRDIVAKGLSGVIVVSDFELQSHYRAHYRTNTRAKSMKFLMPLTVHTILSLLFF